MTLAHTRAAGMWLGESGSCEPLAGRGTRELPGDANLIGRAGWGLPQLASERMRVTSGAGQAGTQSHCCPGHPRQSSELDATPGGETAARLWATLAVKTTTEPWARAHLGFACLGTFTVGG